MPSPGQTGHSEHRGTAATSRPYPRQVTVVVLGQVDVEQLGDAVKVTLIVLFWGLTLWAGVRGIRDAFGKNPAVVQFAQEQPGCFLTLLGTIAVVSAFVANEPVIAAALTVAFLGIGLRRGRRRREAERELERLRASKPCTACGQPNATGHGCHIGPASVVVGSTSRYSRKWGSYIKNVYTGVIRDHYGELRRCGHQHVEREDAIGCAGKLVDRIQTGELQLDGHVIGPRPEATAQVTRIPIADLTERDWRQMLADADYRCDYCKKRFTAHALHKEHVIPLARGGANSVTNIVPSCGPCNRKKGTRTGHEFRKYLDEIQRRATRHGNAEPTPPSQSNDGPEPL